jgi:hypothetical protein
MKTPIQMIQVIQRVGQRPKTDGIIQTTMKMHWYVSAIYDVRQCNGITTITHRT